MLILNFAFSSPAASGEPFSPSSKGPDERSAMGLIQSGLLAYREGGGGAALESWTRDSSTDARRRALPAVSRFDEDTSDFGRFMGERIIAVDRLTPQTIVVYFQLRHEDGYGWGRLVLGSPTGKWEVHQVILDVNPDSIIPGRHRRQFKEETEMPLRDRI